MDGYVRPSPTATVVRDADGRVIDYGSRWEGSPPADSYSVDSHPERFAPLHEVVEALVDHLRVTYDVEVVEGAEVAADLVRPVGEVVRATRVQPRDRFCAALTFVLTSYPAVVLHAGLLYDVTVPGCGCDACDSTWETEADELEQLVRSVVSGGFRETVDRRLHTWVGFSWATADQGASGRARADSIDARRVRAARRRLRTVRRGWAPWPTIDAARVPS